MRNYRRKKEAINVEVGRGLGPGLKELTTYKWTISTVQDP